MNKKINIPEIFKTSKSLLVGLLFIAISATSFSQLNTNRLMSIGRNALYFEDYVLSIQYFNQIIKIRPYQEESYFFRAIAKFSLEDNLGALADCNTCLDINPFYPKAYHLRGDIYIRMSNFEKAIDNYDKVIYYDKKNAAAFLNRGICKSELNQGDEAINDFTEAIRLKGGFLKAYLARGDVYLQKGDTAEAFVNFNKVLTINPYFTPGLATRGLLLLKQNKFEEAYSDYNQAVSLDPDNAGFRINRALIRYQLNDIMGAMDDYNKVEEIDPNNELIYFNRGLLRAQIGDDNNALSDFSKVISFEPDNYMAMYNRALIFKKLGNNKSALADLNTIIKEYPNFPPAYYVRSQVKEKLNDLQGAQRDYNTAFAMERDNRVSGDKKDVVLASNNVNTASKKKDTRENSDKNLNNYKKIVVLSEEKEREKTGFESEIRGEIQNRNIAIDLQDIFYLSVFEQDFHLNRLCYFSEVITKFSIDLSKNGQIYLVNNAVKLEKSQIDNLFQKINDITSVVGAESNRSNWYVYQGIHHGLLKNYLEAIEAFDLAIKENSKNALAYFERANARYKMEQFISSVEDISETNISISLSNTTSKTTNAETSSKSLNIEMVLRDLSRAIEINPSFAFAWYNRANIRVSIKDYIGAINDYSQAIRLNPELAEAYYNRGLTYIFVGKQELGVESLSKSGELGLYNAYNVLKRYSTNNRQ